MSLNELEQIHKTATRTTLEEARAARLSINVRRRTLGSLWFDSPLVREMWPQLKPRDLGGSAPGAGQWEEIGDLEYITYDELSDLRGTPHEDAYVGAKLRCYQMCLYHLLRQTLHAETEVDRDLIRQQLIN